MSAKTTVAEQLRLERVDGCRWKIPLDPKRGMRVEGLVFADDAMIMPLRDDPCLTQVANVATLPGIVGRSLGMPDIHWGYGFPIGGVAALRTEDGVVSPGGIGFDINCGVRLMRSSLAEPDVRPHLDRLADRLFEAVPSGVGARAGGRRGEAELDQVLRRGAAWAVEAGYGTPTDLTVIEERGRLASADPDQVSSRARSRGKDQLGTLGSGNHFLEVQAVDRVLDADAAAALGLAEGQVTVMIHCGSRGLGHQVCTDHLAVMDRARRRYGIELPDRQLACAPLGSPEGAAYLGAMAAAANFAWANRQIIGAAVRAVFGELFGARAGELPLVYDVSHNMAKIEEHLIDGRRMEVCVHRKGATRAFPAGHPAVPEPYRSVGQPVLIPGDMGRHSMVAVGLPGAMEETFGSSCHGAGRLLSRHAALRQLRGQNLVEQLRRDGIVVRAERRDLLAEEASVAYKDVEAVVRVAAAAGHVLPVVRLKPLAVIKG
ncbi:MAG TPA: RtcB family protein [candidate division Zixibacteria bacterium]|nr:RtcB family protein [candidate division Zixibacteria bacterium]